MRESARTDVSRASVIKPVAPLAGSKVTGCAAAKHLKSGGSGFPFMIMKENVHWSMIRFKASGGPRFVLPARSKGICSPWWRTNQQTSGGEQREYSLILFVGDETDPQVSSVVGFSAKLLVLLPLWPDARLKAIYFLINTFIKKKYFILFEILFY